MDKMFLSLGLIGSIISILGNFPMLLHLVKTKDSEGHSLSAWFTWQVANFLLLIYAIYIRDFVFMALQIMWIFFVTVTIFLIVRYRKRGAKNAVTD